MSPIGDIRRHYTKMFIRTKRRRLKKSWPDAQGVYRDDWHALDFSLVSTIRTHSGPRQRVVAYLGTLEERLMSRDWVRARFYKSAIAKLESVTQPDQHESLIKSLEAKVPRA